MFNWSLRRFLHVNLNFHPYKMIIVEELKQSDIHNSKASCKIFENVLSDAVVLFSDKADVYLLGHINKQNSWYRTGHSTWQISKQPLYNECVTIWCGVVEFGSVEQYFFWWRGMHGVTYIQLLYWSQDSMNLKI